jgi:hypothetical protein
MKKSSEEIKEWKPESSHKVLKLSDFLASIYYDSDSFLTIYKLQVIKRTQAISIELA